MAWQVQALLEQPRSAQAAMSATLGTATLITPRNTDEFIRVLKENAIQDVKSRFDAELKEKQREIDGLASVVVLTEGRHNEAVEGLAQQIEQIKTELEVREISTRHIIGDVFVDIRRKELLGYSGTGLGRRSYILGKDA